MTELAPGARLPRLIPVTVDSPGKGKPLIMTLLGVNVAPFGMVSKNVTAAARLPVLLTVMV